MAIWLRYGPPRACWTKCRIALAASMGEPPPTLTIASAPAASNAATPCRMSATGACSPISKNVVPEYAPCALRMSSTVLTTLVCCVQAMGGEWYR